MTKQLFLIFFCWIFVSQMVHCNLPSYYVEHYSTKNGLPQQTVINILQDDKGFMWFTTWNGFCKFDGYKFTNYDLLQNDSYYVKNSRFDKIFQDKYGYIWLQSNDGEVHRFDPRTETFKGLQSEHYPFFSFASSRLQLNLSGKVWISSPSGGCICIPDSSFHPVLYDTDHPLFKGRQLHSVFEDSALNSWLLTDNGLLFMADGDTTFRLFFAENALAGQPTKQPFYSSLEWKDEIWFGSDKGKIWKYSKKNKEFALFELNANSHVKEIYKLPDNRIGIVTPADGLFIYDKTKDSLACFRPETIPGCSGKEIVSSLKDRSGNMWFAMDCYGVFRFDSRKQEISYLESNTGIRDENIFPSYFFITEDSTGRVWVHPKGGGFFLYDPETNKLVPFYENPVKENWRFSNMLHLAYADRQGNLWLSSRAYGLEKITFNQNNFRVQPLGQELYTISNDVRAVFEDRDNNLWVSTKDNKVRIYDKDRNLLGFLSREGTISSLETTIPGVVYCFMQDSKQNIWMGTKGKGIFKLKKQKLAGSLKFDIVHYQHDPTDVFSLSNNNTYSIFQDSKENIWIGSFGGGLNLYRENEQGIASFIHSKNLLKSYPMDKGARIRYLTEDRYGRICLGTSQGLIMFDPDLRDLRVIDYRHYSRTKGEKSGLTHNDILAICNTEDGNMYLATFGGGINKVCSRDKDNYPVAFEAFTRQNGLPSDVVLYVTEDKEQNIWICMENELAKYNPDTNLLETFGEIKRLMVSDNFSEASYTMTHSGDMIWGFSNGLLSFLPQNIRSNTYSPYLALEELRLFNKKVSIGEKGSPLKQHIDNTEKLVLTHKQNFISLQYAAIDFVDPANIMYAYKLSGFDEDWVYVQNQRIANYTNLPKGKYVFHVKSTNSDGVWMDNERQLPVEILPSFWETVWAFLLYVLLTGLLIFAILKTLFVFYRLKDKVKLEKNYRS